jgi:hypothetical protein
MPWRWSDHLLLGRIVERLTTEQVCPRWEFLVEFPVSGELVEFSPLRKNKHSHRRCRSSTPTTLEVTTDMFGQLQGGLMNIRSLLKSLSRIQSLGEK